MSNTAVLATYNVVAKKLDKNFAPIFIIVAILYCIAYLTLVAGYDTKGPNKDEMRKKNLKRAAVFVAQKIEKQTQKEKEAVAATAVATEPVEGESAEVATEKEAVKEQVTEGTKKAVKQSAAQKEKIAEARKARREAAQAKRSAAAGERATVRLAKIQAKSRAVGGGGGDAYASFKTGGGSGDLASKLSSSGGIGIGGGGSGKTGGGGIGRAGGGSGFGSGKGSLDDFLSGGGYGDVTAVEGVDDFKVTPLAVKNKGAQSSSRKTDDLQRELNQRFKTLQQCIKKGRSRNNELTGSIIVQFTIKADGKVNRVRITKKSWSDEAIGKVVEKCITDGIEEWKFTPVENGELTLEQPFIF